MEIWKKGKLKITVVLAILFLLSVFLLDGNKEGVDIGVKAIEPIGEITVSNPVEFSFTANHNHLSGVELLFATYEREDLQGTIEAKVNIADKNVLTDIIDISNIKDNTFYLLEFPVIRDSYGEKVQIQLEPFDLHSGNTVTLWTEDTVREGTKTVFGGNRLENTIVYKERVEKGLNIISVMLLLLLIFHVFLIIIYIKVDDNEILYLFGNLDAREFRITVYIIFGIILIAKMGFYSSYVGRFPDETAHVSYIAYLEETDKIIPEFENMHLFDLELWDDSVTAFRTMNENEFNYLGHSPLYYLILKATNNIEVFNDGNIRINLLFLRWITQGLGLLGVIIYFYIGYKYINSLAATICYASVTTLVPMFAYGISGITNDTLALVGVAVLFLGMCDFEKGENSYRVFFLIGLGVFLSGLSKLTCASVIGIAGICYILYLIKEKQIKRVFCKEFAVTIPLYVIVCVYYIYILQYYGVLHPGVSVIAPREYFIESIWYVAPENRVSLSFLQFAKEYWNGFLDTWISIRSTVSLSKNGDVWKLSGIGTFSILVFSFLGGIISLVKEKKGETKVAGMFVPGLVIAIVTQFFRSYRTGYLVNGRIGSYQSRYYLCCIGIMAFSVCYVFELMASKIGKRYKENSKRDLLVVKLSGIAVCSVYALLLLYDDIIYFLINFIDYL